MMGQIEGRDNALRVCLVHGRGTARKIVGRALEERLQTPVHEYRCCEDALNYMEHYDTFVVYNNFGKRMNGAQGVARLRRLRPDAVILGVTSSPGYRHRFRAAGADDVVLLSGNEIAELTEKVQRHTAA
mgnify:CR=1 FL=1